MTRSLLVILGVVAVVSVTFWMSMRIAGRAELALLPGRCRRRVQWWQGNERTVQLTCAAVAAIAALTSLCVELGTSVG